MNTRPEIWETLKAAADEIEKLDSDMGFYAQRKVAHVSEDSSTMALWKVARDLDMMAQKLEERDS